MKKGQKRELIASPNPNRKQRINVTLHPTTLAELEARIPPQKRSFFIETVIRIQLKLPKLGEDDQ